MTGAVAGTAPHALIVDGLVLRTPSPEDAPAMVAAQNASLEHLRPWMLWAQRAAEEGDTALRLALAREAMDAGGDASWAMFDRVGTDEVVVGACGLHDRVGAGGRDIGYWVHVDWVGRGVATRAAAGLTWVAFERLGLERVEVHCDVDNQRSAAVPQRLGFTHVRTVEDARHSAPANTGRMMIWQLLRTEWDELRGSHDVRSVEG
jgi:RimJ/RimL family protein N-acetyltransferase